MSTTFIKSRSDMVRGDLKECHEVVGTLDWTSVVEAKDVPDRHINFFHDDIIPPNASIGIHTHDDDEEYYYVVSGTGVMTLDGIEYERGEGEKRGEKEGGRKGKRKKGKEERRKKEKREEREKTEREESKRRQE